MDFMPFDPKLETSRKRRRLPHWYQSRRTYFVTFRLADSLPCKAREEIRKEKSDWFRQHGISSADELLELPGQLRRQFRDRFSRRIELLLDNGLGDCVLKDPENSRILANTFRHFDRTRYYLDSFVIMPNHVHLLACPIAPHSLPKILQSWKRYSARKINDRMNRTGQSLWLDESFDHIVRNGDQLERFRRYIEQNPLRAGLRPGEFLLQITGE